MSRTHRALQLAWRAIRRSPVQAMLCAGGVAIGVAAVAVLLALGAAAERALQATFDELGRHRLAINAGRTTSNALRGAARQVETLRLEDWRALSEIRAVERAAPVVMGGAVLRAEGKAFAATVLGSSPELRRLRKDRLLAGRFVTPDDVSNRRRVAVIGRRVVEQLYDGAWPLGASLRVLPRGASGRGALFTVVGVLQAKGASPDGAEQDDQIVVPVTTAQDRLFAVDYLDSIFVQAVSREGMAEASRQARRTLRQRHGLGEREDFEILDQDALLEARAETGDRFAGLLSALAAATLALGGLGLLAVSLLSVRSRGSEIGLRRAVGARQRDILQQFLGEAVGLAFLGGVCGILLGLGVVEVVNRLGEWKLLWTWTSVVYPLAISLLIALVAGAYPAYRASRLDPIVALSLD